MMTQWEVLGVERLQCSSVKGDKCNEETGECDGGRRSRIGSIAW